MNLQTVAVVPIAVGRSQKELSSSYFPRFHSGFTKMFGGKFNILPAETVQNQVIAFSSAQERDYSWEFMVEVGKQLNADALIGLMIEESDSPGKLFEHIKVVSIKNGKILASSNFLVRLSSKHRFDSELKVLRTILTK